MALDWVCADSRRRAAARKRAEARSNSTGSILLKKESSKINVTIPAKKIGNYFPETYSKEQIEEVIFMLLDKWKENKEGVADAEDTV